LHELMEADPSPLIELLNNLPAFLSTPELASTMATLWPEVSRAELQRVTLALISVSTQSLRWSADELGPMISESDDLDLPDEDRGRFGAVIAQLIAAPVLQTSAKAVSVLNQQERLFDEARIMSDIRPIFGDDPTERPAGAVVVHTLSIKHQTDGRLGTINVAMDRNDLVELKSTVDRAIKKADALSGVVEAAGLSLFELQETHE
jgi:hypothetical protein